MVGLKKRMGSVRTSPIQTQETVQVVLRRLGFVVLTVHRVVMASLIEAGKAAQAEELNDWMKPLGDMLLNYEGDENGDPNEDA